MTEESWGPSSLRSIRLFGSPKIATYDAIEDWIGVDSLTGKVVHFHCRFGIVTGEHLVKSYRLPFGPEVLASRERVSSTDLWISSKEWELVLPYL